MGTGEKNNDGGLRLEYLLDVLEKKSVQNMQNINVKKVTSDSRSVKPGDIFVALRGLEVDGHRFVGDAVGRDAVSHHSRPATRIEPQSVRRFDSDLL